LRSVDFRNDLGDLWDDSRFYLGWYVSRGLAVAVSTVVLIALISESMRLYAELSRANALLERERTNKLMTIDAAMSSIAHEVKQPLAIITASVAAARKWLGRAPPNLGEATQLLSDAERSSLHAGEIVENVRKMFVDTGHERQPIDANKLVLEALHILRGELTEYNVTDIALASELRPVMGHKGQLQEVILNLVHNAVDAMAPVEVDRRTLKLTTKTDGTKVIIIEVEDSGEGIKPERLSSIFDAFVTTKSGGTGLGLAICTRIIEQHGGRLTAKSDGKNGAIFKIVLPIEPPAMGTHRVD